MEDRDDIHNVAHALGCPRAQAERVLDALEREGFVAKTERKDRLIEVSVKQPDDYEHRDEASTGEITVHLGVPEARAIAGALQKAIRDAERELVRRATRNRRTRTRDRSK
jgi:DNA-binding transcriptional regulator YhcF (GntR family)